MPKVSIVIPAYNCAAFLPAAMESVFAQSYPDYETIVVDDGSTDDTPSIMAPYRDRVQYIRQENKGLSGARNAGIRAARGEFIALLDADDAWTEKKLEEQMPRFADPEVGIVYSDFSVRYSDGRWLPSYLANRPLASEGYVLESYVESRFLFPSTMIFRKRCMEECGLFDEEMRASEDIELFARMCARWKVARVDLPLTIRYEGVHNITADGEKLGRYTILAFEKVLAKEPNLTPAVRAAIRRELGRQHWWRGYAAFGRGDRKAARADLRQSLLYDAGRSRTVLPVLLASLLPGAVLRRLRRE